MVYNPSDHESVIMHYDWSGIRDFSPETDGIERRWKYLNFRLSHDTHGTVLIIYNPSISFYSRLKTVGILNNAISKLQI